jgi:CRISPR/Cas system CSM-associated protein Csm2 small subunit
MLPSFYQEVYRNFIEALKSLREAVKQSDDEKQAAFAKVEHLYQTQVITLTEEEIDPEIVSRWRSIQTELHRMFKLLATDWLFLRSSRQVSTKKDRIDIFCDRIEQMIKFCRILLEETDL